MARECDPRKQKSISDARVVLAELKRRLASSKQASQIASSTIDPVPADSAQSSASFAELLQGKTHKPGTVKAAESQESHHALGNDVQLRPETEFRNAIGKVRQVNENAVAIEKPKPDIEAKQSLADQAQVVLELLQEPTDLIDGAEAISYLSDGHSPKLLKQLKRAQFQISDELDLHYENQTLARRMLHDFLQQHSAERSACVRIIHGKGIRSQLGAVLKTMVDVELRRRKDVLAFCTAPRAMGGTGAVLVLLRKR